MNTVATLAAKMNVSTSDMGNFVEMLRHEMKNGAVTIEEAIAESQKKMNILLANAKRISESEEGKKFVVDCFYA